LLAKPGAQAQLAVEIEYKQNYTIITITDAGVNCHPPMATPAMSECHQMSAFGTLKKDVVFAEAVSLHSGT
jgi:hypothetical protein